MSEISFDRTTNHGWWTDRKDYIDLYHGTHERNVPHIEGSGVSVPDPKTGMVSMALDPHTAHGYASMSSGPRRGEHSFRHVKGRPVTTPEENRAVTKFRVPMDWVRANVDPDLRGNIGDAHKRIRDKGEYEKWKKANPDKSDHEYYFGSELRFSKPVPPEFYVGHSYKFKKKTLKEFKEDAMISFRKKVEAKGLVPTRSGSKGNGDAGNGNGGDGGDGNGG